MERLGVAMYNAQAGNANGGCDADGGRRRHRLHVWPRRRRGLSRATAPNRQLVDRSPPIIITQPRPPPLIPGTREDHTGNRAGETGTAAAPIPAPASPVQSRPVHRAGRPWVRPADAAATRLRILHGDSATRLSARPTTAAAAVFCSLSPGIRFRPRAGRDELAGQWARGQLRVCLLADTDTTRGETHCHPRPTSQSLKRGAETERSRGARRGTELPNRSTVACSAPWENRGGLTTAH